MKRQARLFAMAEYLRGRRTGVTAETIAERFGVTMRTAYRDLAALKDAEFPIRADRGRGGGYALDKNYSLPPVNFTAREAALVLTIGRWATQMRFMPFTQTLSAALDKVRAALSSSAQRELNEHIETLQFIGVPARALDPAVALVVERGWFERQALTIRYRDAMGVLSTRQIEVRGVVMDRGFTLLQCEEGVPPKQKSFRLDRIEAATFARKG
jgi:predicted DNA-binding transcriptional regulator YafY